MNEILFVFWGIVVTPWKIIGYLGVGMFTSRWFVQMWASRKAGKPVIPRMFWFLSVAGSLFCLLYYTFGKNDSVGILAFLFPTCTASYNLFLDITHQRKQENGEISEG
jgi:lipid-A-disaccharide synthase-like uncharacterized protein